MASLDSSLWPIETSFRPPHTSTTSDGEDNFASALEQARREQAQSEPAVEDVADQQPETSSNAQTQGDQKIASGLQLAQVEPPEPDMTENQPSVGGTEPTDEDLNRAEVDPNPTSRMQAYESGRNELRKLDPTSPDVGDELTPQGWTPSASDIERVRNGLADARIAQSLGISPETYRDLARDPDRGDQVTAKGRQERDAVISAWQGGQIPGPPVRDTSGADYRDARGRQWDVKSFNSNYPTGFTLPQSADNIDRELRAGEGVIVNTEDMSKANVDALKAEGQRRGWSSNDVVYVNPHPFSQMLPPEAGLPGANR